MDKRVVDEFLVYPTISKWPYHKFIEFKRFAKENADDVYWLAISLLLERSKRLELLEGMDYNSPSSKEEEEDSSYVATLGG